MPIVTSVSWPLYTNSLELNTAWYGSRLAWRRGRSTVRRLRMSVPTPGPGGRPCAQRTPRRRGSPRQLSLQNPLAPCSTSLRQIHLALLSGVANEYPAKFWKFPPGGISPGSDGFRPVTAKYREMLPVRVLRSCAGFSGFREQWRFQFFPVFAVKMISEVKF